jgi:type III secretory pathway lipoprotein EscJ
MDSPDTVAPERRPLRAGPAQVIALGLVAASIGWGVWLLRDRPTNEEVELLPGTVLPSSELAIVEAAFDRAQLAGHRTEDGRVWVPRVRQSAYMRALVDAEALPREFGSSLRRALERNSPWQSRAAQEEMLRVAVQEELAHVICSMPGIERAAVLYDVEDRPVFDGSLAAGPARTASVNVRTQPDVELEPARVQAIRVLVAASIAGLAPERVAVTDLRSGRVHAGPLTGEPDTVPDASTDPAIAGRISLERHLAAKVRQAISFVKGVVVDVTISAPAPTAPDLGPPAHRQRVADANAPAEVATEPAPPAPRPESATESIVVSLAVPDTWYDAALAAAGQRDPATSPAASARIEEDRLREHVLQSLPPSASPADRRVLITRFPVAPPKPQPGPRQTAATAAPVAPAAAHAQAPGKPKTIGDYIDVTLQAISDGRFGDIPREAWMVITAKCSAVLAYLVFRASGRGHVSVESAQRGRPSGRRIDWSAIDHDDDEAAPRDERRRMAA